MGMSPEEDFDPNQLIGPDDVLPGDDGLSRAVLDEILHRDFATWVREHREALEYALDAFIESALLDITEDTGPGDQENRVAMTALALMERAERDPFRRAGIFVALVLGLERLAALSPQERETARASSLRRATTGDRHA